MSGLSWRIDGRAFFIDPYVALRGGAPAGVRVTTSLYV